MNVQTIDPEVLANVTGGCAQCGNPAHGKGQGPGRGIGGKNLGQAAQTGSSTASQTGGATSTAGTW
jgi:hypothetical protein